MQRSAKKTAEILHRRGLELEAQVEVMKATIYDLEAVAKFFESTATEASVRTFSIFLVSTRGLW
jgi:unconventional prefoldin RPB5 interactor 1